MDIKLSVCRNMLSRCWSMQMTYHGSFNIYMKCRTCRQIWTANFSYIVLVKHGLCTKYPSLSKILLVKTSDLEKLRGVALLFLELPRALMIKLITFILHIMPFHRYNALRIWIILYLKVRSLVWWIIFHSN